jgi:hypothetical protein
MKVTNGGGELLDLGRDGPFTLKKLSGGAFVLAVLIGGMEGGGADLIQSGFIEQARVGSMDGCQPTQ